MQMEMQMQMEQQQQQQQHIRRRNQKTKPPKVPWIRLVPSPNDMETEIEIA
jgi:hypothetical protein